MSVEETSTCKCSYRACYYEWEELYDIASRLVDDCRDFGTELAVKRFGRYYELFERALSDLAFAQMDHFQEAENAYMTETHGEMLIGGEEETQ